MRAVAVVLLVAGAVAGAPAAEFSGAALDYAINCQGCHHADGSGTPGTVPPLAGSVGKFTGVPGGREYLIRVPGVSQAPLDDAALARVVNWMLDRFGHDDLPPDFAPYTADEFGRLRRDPLTDVETARRGLLERLR